MLVNCQHACQRACHRTACVLTDTLAEDVASPIMTITLLHHP